MKTKAVKAGDKCPDCKKSELIPTLTCNDDECGCTVHHRDGYKILGYLNQIQTDLLSSFLVEHWKEISEGEHRVAFERILETLNPGALKAIKSLSKAGRKK